MPAPTKRARKIRASADFDVARLRSALGSPKSGRISLTSWTLEQIFAARDAQLRGQFYLPARLAESMRTDDALAVALENRLAPQRSIEVEMIPAKGAKGERIAEEAAALFGQDGVGITPETMASIHACLVNHDVAFAVCTATPRPDGSRVDLEMHAWPIEYVRWDPYYRVFRTQVDPETLKKGELSTVDPDLGYTSGYDMPITHGDGRWVIFQRFEIDPFKHAALLAAAIVWARHAFAIRDWSKASVAHGSAKVIGEMPQGVALQNETGLTPEAEAMAELLRSISSSDSPVGIRPAGSKTEFLTNSSTAWQVWTELVGNAERAAARIYLGTDGTLGTTGGAPGIDISSLFGVATTKVTGDLKCLEKGILTGVIEPWCAMNFGDSSLAPTRRYMVPDTDSDLARESEANRRRAFFSDIESATKNGFAITQDYVDSVATTYGVAAPVLPTESDTVAPTITLAPADLARVISVNEARASAGLAALTLPGGAEDPDGLLTVEQFGEKKRADTETAAAEAAAAIAGGLPFEDTPVVEDPPAAPSQAPEPVPPSPLELAQHAAQMTAALLSDIREARQLGIAFSQEQINETAERYGVPAPRLTEE